MLPPGALAPLGQLLSARDLLCASCVSREWNALDCAANWLPRGGKEDACRAVWSEAGAATAIRRLRRERVWPAALVGLALVAVQHPATVSAAAVLVFPCALKLTTAVALAPWAKKPSWMAPRRLAASVRQQSPGFEHMAAAVGAPWLERVYMWRLAQRLEHPNLLLQVPELLGPSATYASVVVPFALWMDLWPSWMVALGPSLTMVVGGQACGALIVRRAGGRRRRRPVVGALCGEPTVVIGMIALAFCALWWADGTLWRAVVGAAVAGVGLLSPRSAPFSGLLVGRTDLGAHTPPPLGVGDLAEPLLSLLLLGLWAGAGGVDLVVVVLAPAAVGALALLSAVARQRPAWQVALLRIVALAGALSWPAVGPVQLVAVAFWGLAGGGLLLQHYKRVGATQPLGRGI